jgi:hypothetical protein
MKSVIEEIEQPVCGQWRRAVLKCNLQAKALLPTDGEQLVLEYYESSCERCYEVQSAISTVR